MVTEQNESAADNKPDRIERLVVNGFDVVTTTGPMLLQEVVECDREAVRRALEIVSSEYFRLFMMGLPKKEWGSMAKIVLQHPAVASRFFHNDAEPSQLATLIKSLLHPEAWTSLPFFSITAFLVGISSYFSKLDSQILPYLAIQRYALWAMPTLLAQYPDKSGRLRGNEAVERVINSKDRIDHLPVLDIKIVGRQLIAQAQPWLCNDSEPAFWEGVAGNGDTVTRKVLVSTGMGENLPLALIKDYTKPVILVLKDCQTADGWFLPEGLLLSSDKENVTDKLRAVLVASPSVVVNPEQLKERNLKWAPIRSIKPWKNKKNTAGWLIKHPLPTFDQYQKLAQRMLVEENS